MRRSLTSDAATAAKYRRTGITIPSGADRAEGKLSESSALYSVNLRRHWGLPGAAMKWNKVTGLSRTITAKPAPVLNIHIPPNRDKEFNWLTL